MPMLTTSVTASPVWPRQAPLRTRSLKSRILRQHGVDVRHDVPAIDQDRPIGAVAQRDVQDRAVLGGVDPVAREHARAPGLELACAGEVEQQPHRLLGDAVLGVVEQQVTRAQREPREPVGVGGEQLAQVHRGHGFGMSLERPPRGRPGETGHGVPYAGRVPQGRCGPGESGDPRPVAGGHGITGRDPGAADAQHVRQRQVARRDPGVDASCGAEARLRKGARRAP